MKNLKTLEELNEAAGTYVEPAIKTNGDGSIAVFFNIQPTQSLSLLPGAQTVFETAVQTAAGIADVTLKKDGSSWTFKKGSKKYWLVQSNNGYTASIRKDSQFGSAIKTNLNTVDKLVKTLKEIMEA